MKTDEKKKVPEKTPLRFWDQLQLGEISFPSKRDEFNRVGRAFKLNLSVSAISALYALCGIFSLFAFRVPLGLRLSFIAVGIVAAWLLWHCGRGALSGAKMLTCPECKDLLTSQGSSLLETGCCRKCGYTALID